jgi:hypothetical protein
MHGKILVIQEKYPGTWAVALRNSKLKKHYEISCRGLLVCLLPPLVGGLPLNHHRFSGLGKISPQTIDKNKRFQSSPSLCILCVYTIMSLKSKEGPKRGLLISLLEMNLSSQEKV